MKINAWVLPFISLIALSVSPADAQAALRGLQRGGGGGRARPPSTSIGVDRGRGGGVTLLGVGKELSTFGRTRMIVEVDADGRDGPAAKCARLARASGGSVVRVFHRAMTGCAIEMSNVAVASMGRSTVVKSMEPDHEVHALADIPDPTWGLDRTDQCGALQSADPSSGATYSQRDATGVRVYIVDTGVNAVQQDLVPYISSHTPTCHADTSGDGGNALEDANGHGTHVAGTACGDRWGVATNCEICAVQVLTSSGSGSTTGVIAGIEFLMNDCPAGARCVANMSLGGGFSTSLNDAVKNAVNAGVTMVVAAGNSNANACGASPASSEEAITVGSMTEQETVSGFSNWGDCVNIDAPGSGITSGWIPNADSTNTISGTSMASPHVAGLAAGILRMYPEMTPAQVLEKIKDDAKVPGFKDNGGDRLVMIANSEGNCPGPAPTPPPTPTPPCPSQQVRIKVDLKTDNYPSETSWDVKNSSGQQVFASGSYSAPGADHSDESECLEPSTFTFTINDTYGDGICCSYGQGSYKVFLDGEEVASGGSFASSESATFGDAPPAPTPTNPPGPAPTNPPVPAPTNPPVPAPTNPPTPNPTDQPTPNPTDQPTPNPTSQPTPNPTDQPTPNPTDQPTPNPTAQPTEAPTYKTCNMFTINECTSDKGCQWTGNCKNCGCHLCLDGLPENCPNSR